MKDRKKCVPPGSIRHEIVSVILENGKVDFNCFSYTEYNGVMHSDRSKKKIFNCKSTISVQMPCP